MPLEFQWYATSTYERMFLTTVTSLERDSTTMLSLHVTVSPPAFNLPAANHFRLILGLTLINFPVLPC